MKGISSNVGSDTKAVRTNIPARLDRLPWSRWHWLVVVSLGITWILDGLEVTIVGSIAAVLTDKQTLHLSDVQVAAAGTIYLAGLSWALCSSPALPTSMGAKCSLW